MKTKSSMTKAELITECKRLEQENEELRDRVDMLMKSEEAYFSRLKHTDRAHKQTIKKLVPLTDMRTELHNRTVKQTLAGRAAPYEAIHVEACCTGCY